MSTHFKRETNIEYSARVQRRVRVVDHRKRCDCLKMRRLCLSDEELRNSGIGESDHSDAVRQYPRLRRDRFDRVVTIRALESLEELE